MKTRTVNENAKTIVKPTRNLNDFMSSVKKKSAQNRQRRNEDVSTSSTSGVGGGTPARITLIPPTRNGSVDVQDSGETWDHHDGQRTLSLHAEVETTKAASGAKQGGASGLLARGQKLLKRLTHSSENNGHEK